MKFSYWIVHLLTLPLRWVLNFRFCFQKNYKQEIMPEMAPTGPSGYTEKPFYLPGEKISFHLSSEHSFSLEIQIITAPFTYQAIENLTFSFEAIKKEAPSDVSEKGCGWHPDLTIEIPAHLEKGYYRALLKDSKGNEGIISFVIGSKAKADVAVIVPFSTWTAYNPFGGKSAYRNILDKKNIHYISTLRPNTALQYAEDGKNIHDMNIEVNIFQWLCSKHSTSLYPDYFLEEHPELFKQTKVLVLSYHCEYISSGIYRSLRHLLQKGASLISVGGNQLFWKVKWHANYTRMEVRKDFTFFKNSVFRGTLWRYTLFPEKKFLGVHYTDSGIGTFAPYEVLDPNHWLYEGCDLKKGDLFGHSGINPLPVCGDETDKSDLGVKDVEVIARGKNRKDEGTFATYNPDDKEWNSEGGGEVCIKYLPTGAAVLSTGSIQSGSGLGKDAVLSRVVENFLNRYLSK